MFVLVTVSVALFIVTGFYVLKRKHDSYLPGPRGFPFFGNSLDVNSNNIHMKLLEWTKIYGDIYQINLFGSNFVVINSPDLVREALITEPNATIFADRIKSSIANEIMYGSKDIVVSQYSKLFVKRRKLGHIVLSAYGEGLTTIEKSILEHLEIQVSRLKCLQGRIFDPELLIDEFLAGVIGMLVTGKKLEYDSEWSKTIQDYNNDINKLLSLDVSIIFDWFPFIKYVPCELSRLYRRCRENQRKFEEFVRNEKENTNNIGMIHRLYKEMKQKEQISKDNDWLNEQTVFAVLTDMFAAGILTSKSTLLSAIQILVCKRDIQNKLREEVDHVVGCNRLPLSADKAYMPYTEAFIFETLRFTSIVPFPIHRVTANTTLGGFNIQKGSGVIFNLFNMHHSKSHYYNPDEFLPERFLDSTGRLLPISSPERRNFLPFGIGKRSCIGDKFAMNRIFMFIATMMQHFTFESEDGVLPNMLNPCDMEQSIVRMPKSFICRAIKRNINMQNTYEPSDP